MGETNWSDSASEANVEALFRDLGVDVLYIKFLSRNHNSKNQIYLAPDLADLSMLPLGDITENDGHSAKRLAGPPIFHSPIPWIWISGDGLSPAPNAQVIYYPQYPEVRLSGLLLGSNKAPKDLLSIGERGQEDGRILVYGIANGKIYGTLLSSLAPAAKGLSQRRDSDSLITKLELNVPNAISPLKMLRSELARIHSLGWLYPVQLKNDGLIQPCSGNRCAGHTLEAHLGVPMNGLAEPDFRGWEVKAHKVGNLARPSSGRITLFTPEPDLGAYAENGVAWFAAHFGHLNPAGTRLDFNGIHSASKGPNPRTGLSLGLSGYDPGTRKFSSDGFVGLFDQNGEVISGWSFAKLLGHWQRKHSQAAYVPVVYAPTLERKFKYGNIIHLGLETRFSYFLDSLSSGQVLYDPGIKSELQVNNSWKAKARSQFRVNFKDLDGLYTSFAEERLDTFEE